jgi:hypothetical protein
MDPMDPNPQHCFPTVISVQYFSERCLHTLHQAVTGRLAGNLMVKSGSEKRRFSLSIPNAFSTKMRKKVVDMDRVLGNRSEETRDYRPKLYLKVPSHQIRLG